jgi:hypothetical protein
MKPLAIMYDRTPAVVAKVLGTIAEPTFGRALGSGAKGKGQSENRPVVRIVRCARFLLDPDNLVASSKFIIDRLVESGAIPGDTEADIRLEVSQIQVTAPKEVGTSVRVFYP